MKEERVKRRLKMKGEGRGIRDTDKRMKVFG